MQGKVRHRVILDTNIWVSFLISGHLSKAEALLRSERVTILLSETLLQEIVEVVQRPKFRKLFTADDQREMVSVLLRHSELVTVTSVFRECRDPKDDFLLALAVDGKATHIVTGDRDLLALSSFKGTRIRTLAAFRLGEP